MQPSAPWRDSRVQGGTRERGAVVKEIGRLSPFVVAQDHFQLVTGHAFNSAFHSGQVELDSTFILRHRLDERTKLTQKYLRVGGCNKVFPVVCPGDGYGPLRPRERLKLLMAT